VIKKVLSDVGLPPDWAQHGVGREVFAAELGEGACAFLRGEQPDFTPFQSRMEDQWQYFQDRWLAGRIARSGGVSAWKREDWRLWPDE
jgi:hypothetical protein